MSFAGGVDVTVTATESLALPPAPVQVIVKVELAVRLPVDWLPEVALEPLHAPLAVQDEALEEFQVRVLGLPLTTLVGFAFMSTVGAGGALTVTDALSLPLPPGPVQVSV